jgi:DNA repair protein RecN (Recombination protein N)
VLHELAISDLGVIDRLDLVLSSGMTAVTGETGAGKTMVVEAISLLMGGRADGAVVRTGADEAVVEGRFVAGDEEHVLRRVVPREGRSRAYIDGRLATVGLLAEIGATLVDLHGQHAHQSLLSGTVQRGALDRYGHVDLSALVGAKADLAAIDAALADLGGDDRARVREIDLYKFQVDELQRAAISGPDEDQALDLEEDALADAVAHREAGTGALEALSGDGAASDALAGAVALLAGRPPFADLADRLHAAANELSDITHELRARAEAIDENPERLAEVRARRQLLHELRRKYGASLADVLTYQAEAERRLDELVSHDERAAGLDRRRAAAVVALGQAEAAVRAARVAAAPALAAAVQAHLGDLAMGKARLAVEVDGPAGDEVRLLLAANLGSPPLPLAKVASGGELARTMLALRLVLTLGPQTLVFDEVDAGIGGQAATAVGAALAALGSSKQVLVVTHLPQVAAFADQQVLVEKSDDGVRTTASVRALRATERVVELSRMLSGSPDSAAARKHAKELLEAAHRPNPDRPRASGVAEIR